MENYSRSEEQRRRFDRRLVRSLVDYPVVVGFLALVNWQTSPHTWWVAWVAAGWGLHILLLIVRRLTDCDEECDYR